MPSWVQEFAGPYGALPLEDSSRWNQRDQHRQDLVLLFCRMDALDIANQFVILGRRSSSQLESSQQLTTPPILQSFLPAHTVNVLSSSLPLTPVLLPLPGVSPLVTSPTTSLAHSKNLALSSSPILAPMLKLSRKLPTSISLSSLSVTQTPLQNTSTWLFQPTTKVVTKSV